MALPSGYKRLRYIESSGTQYIDTGVLPNNNMRVALEFQATSSALTGIFGSRADMSTDAFVLWIINNTTVGPQFGTNAYNSYPLSANVTAQVIYDFNENILTANGNTIVLPSASFDSAVALTLFAVNSGNTIDGRRASGMLFFVQIYDNGQLVRDYVPCKNPSGEVGLYDLVGAQFYGNSGTGVFEAGPEVIPNYGVAALQDAQLTIGTSATISLDLVVIDPDSGEPLNITVNSVSGTVNGAATTWTLSGGLWTATAPLSELGQYLCVFDVATSDGKTVEMRLPLYYGVLSLITDRAQSDVDELLSILQTPFVDWTTEQAQLFYSGMSKGAYNASDLNRVGAAMVYIAERMASMGYAVADIAPKLYWMDTDVVTQSDMSAYLSDLAALRAVLELPGETPTVPADMAELTFAEANDIEQILLIINTIITNITLAYRYAGELYGGEV